MFFLAMVGLIVLLYLGKKLFDNTRKTFENIEKSLSNSIVSRTYTKWNVPVKDKHIKDKIDTMKGDGTYDEYMDTVQKEIDELTN